MPLELACVVGARPNFPKMAPLLRALRTGDLAGHANTTLINTGQHYDASLSEIFLSELEMPPPDISLEVGSGSHAVQTARVLERMEKVLLNGPVGGGKFDWVVVVGDVNSTMAAALAAAKLGIRVAHVEAGLRSFDRTMPEEINRIVTDSISSLLLVSEQAGIDNLMREGHSPTCVKLVGNVMIDTLYRMLGRAKALPIVDELCLQSGHYGVLTMHRPANVDDPATLTALVEVLIEISEEIPFVFPVHPRTNKALIQSGLRVRMERASGLRLLGPLGYLSFLSLTSQARVIITDSGGLQEESTVLGIPCLTLRSNTERPITVTSGTSSLLGNDAGALQNALQAVLSGRYKSSTCPTLWDGHAAERIAESLING